MAIRASALMHIGHDIRAGVTGSVTGCIPDKVSRIVATMTGRAIGMTIKTTNCRSGHDHIKDRCIRSTKIGRSGRIMTLSASQLMQGQDTIGTRPCVGE